MEELPFRRYTENPVEKSLEKILANPVSIILTGTSGLSILLTRKTTAMAKRRH